MMVQLGQDDCALEYILALILVYLYYMSLPRISMTQVSMVESKESLKSLYLPDCSYNTVPTKLWLTQIPLSNCSMGCRCYSYEQHVDTDESM